MARKKQQKKCKSRNKSLSEDSKRIAYPKPTHFHLFYGNFSFDMQIRARNTLLHGPRVLQGDLAAKELGNFCAMALKKAILK